MIVRRLLPVLVLLLLPLWGEDAAIEAIKSTMGEQKASFDQQLAQYQKQKEALDKLLERYTITVAKKEKNLLADQINTAKREVAAAYEKAVELKEAYNTSAFHLAQKRHEVLSKILDSEEMVLAQKEQSCLNLSVEQCRQKAYDVSKQEVEKLSKEAIIKRVEESGIEVARDKIETGVQYNVKSYAGVDEGYYFAIKGDVNGQLTLDEREMFPVATITWNEQFQEPEEVAQIPLDNLDTPQPEGLIDPEKIAPSVYHSGFYVAADLSWQDQELSGGGEVSTYALSLKGGFKQKDKTRYYLGYEYADDGDAPVTLMGVHVDWAFDMEKMIYPFWGVGYSYAKLEGDGYDYTGSAYHLRFGGGYEMSDELQIDMMIEYERLQWMVSNGDTNIYDLGIHRNVMRYAVSVSYLF